MNYFPLINYLLDYLPEKFLFWRIKLSLDAFIKLFKPFKCEISKYLDIIINIFTINSQILSFLWEIKCICDLTHNIQLNEII